MLDTLQIRNYALIDQLEIQFGAGLNALSGETGAGKSIAVGALKLVLGARASSDVIRGGADSAKVDALFRLPNPSPPLTALLTEHGLDLDGDELLLSRVVTREGRSRAYANGSLIPVSLQAAIGAELVDLHGQHDHQSLLQPRNQLLLLDAFAGHIERAAELKRIVAELRDAERVIQELSEDDRERSRRIEFLKFEVNEIDQAKLEPDEEEALEQKRTRMMNAERFATLSQEAYASLFESEEDTAASDAVSRAARAVDELVTIDPGLAPLAGQLAELLTQIEDISRELRSLCETVEYEPEELDAVNARLVLIRELSRKYGDGIDAIRAYRDRAHAEIDAFENRDTNLKKMREEAARLRDAAAALAQTVSKARHRTARKLSNRVVEQLKELGMPAATFRVQLSPKDLTASGIDRAEYLFSANTGEAPRPLQQVASGGEISRVMLALKSVFAHADAVPTLIFDEIDSGVGGAVAGAVAQKLREVSQAHQVVCVTHLPQIAAAAGTHFSVSKRTQRGKTVTRIDGVEGAARVEELARMLDGAESEVSREHARTLLEKRAS